MWTIFNSYVLKDIINIFLFYHSFKLTWSATDRRLVGDRSPTGRRPVASSRKEVPTRSQTSRRSVGNQSPTSRRPTAKPSSDSSATSGIVLNFGRGEVAERLQCMSDWGLIQMNNYRVWVFTLKEAIWLDVTGSWPLKTRRLHMYKLQRQADVTW